MVIAGKTGSHRSVCRVLTAAVLVIQLAGLVDIIIVDLSMMIEKTDVILCCDHYESAMPDDGDCRGRIMKGSGYAYHPSTCHDFGEHLNRV